jgi:hypothetical protein
VRSRAGCLLVEEMFASAPSSLLEKRKGKSISGLSRDNCDLDDNKANRRFERD